MIRKISIAVLVALFGTGAAQANQSIYPNSGGTFTVGTAIGSNIALAAAPIANNGGTLSFHCQITSTSTTATLEQWSCSSGAFSLTAKDGSVVAAIFSTGSLSFSGSSFNGYSYQFNGSFIGTLKKAGITTAISGATTQFITGLHAQLGPQGAPVTGGTTGVNSLLGPLYIADYNNARIVHTDDLFGSNLTSFHGGATNPDHFFGPVGITVDALENIFVTDGIACRVVKLQDMSGRGLTTLGSCGSGVKQFSSPAGIALDDLGRIYVADSGNNRIVRMDDMTGANWTMLGSLGAGVKEFSNPLDVAVDAAGHIYVADSANNRIVRMDDMSGTNWTTLTIGAAGNQALTRPSGISVDTSGKIYIADSGLLVRVDNMTGLNWSSFLTGDSTNYVSVDPSGTIYVTGGAISRVDDLEGAGWTTSGIVANAQGIHAPGSQIPIGSLVVSPKSIIFGPVTVDKVSMPQVFTLTNQGTGPLKITSISAPAGFALSNTCPASLTPGDSCVVNVTFVPTEAVAYTGNVVFGTNGLNPKINAAVSGTGELPPAAISAKPTSLTFPTQLIDTTSLAQTVTIANTGGQAMTLALSITSDYKETTTCSATLVGGDHCMVYVEFAPAVTGPISGGLVIATNTATPTVVVAMNGVGGATPGILTMTPTALNFGSQLLNTSSAPKAVTVKNTGGSTLNITGLAITGPFTVASTCGTSLDAGETCTLTIKFTPVSPGEASGAITLSNNEKPATVTTTLSGVGTAPTGGITLTPSALSFAAQAVGTVSTAANIKLTNTSALAVNLKAFTVTGPFAQTTSCLASLAPGATCTVSVTFAPVASGVAAGALTIANSSTTPNLTATLTGTGTASKSSALILSPASLRFGTEVVHIASVTKPIELTNAGTGQINLWNISTTGGFLQTNNCGTGIAAGASCTVNVAFDPASTGPVSGALQVSNDSATPQATADLFGTGTAPTAWLAEYNVNFPIQLLNTVSAPQSILLGNAGSGALTVSSIKVTGPFQASTNCGVTVPVNGYCLISVTFNPGAAGLLTGTLSIADNDAGYPASQSVQLSGTGSATTPAYNINPGGLLFLPEAVGTSSAPQNIVITNNGASPLPIRSITISGKDFSQTNTCAGSIAANSSCVVSITFTPTAKGTKSGAASLSVGAGNGFAVQLTGVGD